MFEKVRIYCKHASEIEAKEHAAFCKSKNPAKILDYGHEHTANHGHTSWVEIEQWVDKSDDE